jgi:DNA-binding NarL/FixJ family response regulator
MTAKKIKEIKAQALKLHTHVVVFKSNSMEETVAAMAQFGQTTKAIAERTGLSPAQVQYRVSKAQNTMGTRFRSDFRNYSEMAQTVMKTHMGTARNVIQKNVAVKFMPLAASRLNQ